MDAPLGYFISTQGLTSRSLLPSHSQAASSGIPSVVYACPFYCSGQSAKYFGTEWTNYNIICSTAGLAWWGQVTLINIADPAMAGLP